MYIVYAAYTYSIRVTNIIPIHILHNILEKHLLGRIQ